MENFVDENSDIRFSWNEMPANKNDAKRMVIPCGLHYSPFKTLEENEILEYPPVKCKTCNSVLNPYVKVDFTNKAWWCLFCKARNIFPSHYSEHISPETLPIEMQEGSNTVEYKYEGKTEVVPNFIFVIDVAMEEEEELTELKEALISAIENIPKDSKIVIVSYGKHCQVHEINFEEFQSTIHFKGDKEYQPAEIYSQLGLKQAAKGKSPDAANTPLIGTTEEHELNITTIIDEMTIDGFKPEKGKRPARCTGLAVNIAITLGEALFFGESTRIMTFIGGSSSIGKGRITSENYVDTIRSNLDFKNKTNQTRFFTDAFKYYNDLSVRAMRASLVVDLYSAAHDQVGLKEMRKLPERTGGYILLTDSFSTMVFRDTIKNIFTLDEEDNLKNSYKGRMEFFSTPDLKVCGGIGYMVSMNISNRNVSENTVGEGDTRVWNLGGADQNSTYTLILEPGQEKASSTVSTPIQIVTLSVASDSTIRVRVTTVNRRLIAGLTSSNKSTYTAGFDQEAAMILMGKLGVVKGESTESSEVLQWLDKALIRMLKQFASYKKDMPSSFKMPREMSYFPQFVYYFRRSYFVHPFNCSLDENTVYKLSLLHETVSNCSIMIQPLLYEYSSDNPEPNPIFLDIASMQNDKILLLDTFFRVCVWHGVDVCDWRNKGLQYEEGYEYLDKFLSTPQENAEEIVLERTPTPSFVSCDSGSGQERILKFVLSPSNTGSDQLKALKGFVSDDIDWKTFNNHLIKLCVQP